MKTFIRQLFVFGILCCAICIALFLLVPSFTSSADTSNSSSAPDLPLLNAWRKVLTQIAPTIQDTKFTLKELDVANLEILAWIDDTSLLVTINDTPLNGDKQIPIYIYPLQNSPSYAKILADKKIQLGGSTLFISKLKNREGKTVTEVLRGDQTLSISFSNNKDSNDVNKELDLPKELYMPDLGVPDVETGKRGHAEEFRIYNANGKIVTRIKRPPDVFAYGSYSLSQMDKYWILAVRSAKNAKAARSIDRAETGFVIMTCSKTDGTVRSVRRIDIDSSLLSAELKNIGVSEQRIDRFSTLNHPVFSTSRQKWLFRKVEDIILDAEKLTIAELWECDANGSNRRLLDIRGWYYGPDSHQYTFHINEKQVIEKYEPSINLAWRPQREMIPAISPNGEQIAYDRNNVIQIRNVP